MPPFFQPRGRIACGSNIEPGTDARNPPYKLIVLYSKSGNFTSKVRSEWAQSCQTVEVEMPTKNIWFSSRTLEDGSESHLRGGAQRHPLLDHSGWRGWILGRSHPRAIGRQLMVLIFSSILRLARSPRGRARRCTSTSSSRPLRIAIFRQTVEMGYFLGAGQWFNILRTRIQEHVSLILNHIRAYLSGRPSVTMRPAHLPRQAWRSVLVVLLIAGSLPVLQICEWKSTNQGCSGR